MRETKLPICSVMMACLLIAFLPGCKQESDSDQDKANSSEQQATTTGSVVRQALLQSAEHRRDTAATKLEQARLRMKRFLTEVPLDDGFDDVHRPFNYQDVLEVEKRIESLDATYTQLSQASKAGNYQPSDEERLAIESSQQIIAIDAQIRELRIALLQIEARASDHEVIQQMKRDMEAQIAELETERQKVYASQTDQLLKAKLKQTKAVRDALAGELATLTTQLEAWTEKRRRNVRLLQQYESLETELEAAKRELEQAEEILRGLQ